MSSPSSTTDFDAIVRREYDNLAEQSMRESTRGIVGTTQDSQVNELIAAFIGFGDVPPYRVRKDVVDATLFESQCKELRETMLAMAGIEQTIASASVDDICTLLSTYEAHKHRSSDNVTFLIAATERAALTDRRMRHEMSDGARASGRPERVREVALHVNEAVLEYLSDSSIDTSNLVGASEEVKDVVSMDLQVRLQAWADAQIKSQRDTTLLPIVLIDAHMLVKKAIESGSLRHRVIYALTTQPSQ